MLHISHKNIKNIFVLGLFLLLGNSCVNNFPKPPKAVYQEKEMVALNVELLLANEWLSYYTGKNILGKNELTDTVFKAKIFKDLNIDEAKLKKSMDFYDKFPALQTRISDSVYHEIDRKEFGNSDLDTLTLDMNGDYKPEDFKKFRERYLNKK